MLHNKIDENVSERENSLDIFFLFRLSETEFSFVSNDNLSCERLRDGFEGLRLTKKKKKEF